MVIIRPSTFVGSKHINKTEFIILTKINIILTLFFTLAIIGKLNKYTIYHLCCITKYD